jgi:XTP/dITP diphosphohydrolase
MKLILATKNENKVEELRAMFEGFDLVVTSLFDHPEIGDIVEDGNSFRENAFKKAKVVLDKTDEWVLADDSGLVVDALNGAPGIFSARYAGGEKDYAANNQKLLEDLRDVPNGKRWAAFVSVMTLLGPNGEEYVVEGRCEGVITRELTGSKGFGYDPLFYLPGKGLTMAELSMEEKNKISHRGMALAQVKDILLDILRDYE